jgi:membrane dipeptidase
MAGSICKNNKIFAEAAEAAEKVLQPSRKDIEHGFELHKGSVVIDTYCFTPNMGFDIAACQALYDKGATQLEIANCLERTTMTLWAEDAKLREEALDAWREAGVTCLFANAGQEETSLERSVLRMANRTHSLDLLDGGVKRASFPNDILAAKKNSQLALTFSANVIPIASPHITTEGMLKDIQTFFNLGCRMMHLTYNRRNLLADGCAEEANGGLSDFGRQTIAEMNRVGMMIDVAHTGWNSSLEAAKVSEKPIIASHSGSAKLNGHFRMKPDDVVKAIAEKGGLVGVVCVSTFLGGKGDINALLDHIDYIVKLVGVDHVSIGTDQGYTSERMERDLAALPSMREGIRWYRHLWPGGNAGAKEQELRKAGGLLWINWKYFTVGLVQRGYSDAGIQKILGGNLLRVAKDVLPESLKEAPFN